MTQAAHARIRATRSQEGVGHPAPERETVVRAGRRWTGLDAALVDVPSGITRVAASANHRLGVHAGRPVRAICHFDGRTHRRLQSRGDIDLVPAGCPGTWEDDRPTRILRLGVAPELLRSTALAMEVDPDRLVLAARTQARDPRLEHISWAIEAELRADAPSDRLYGEGLATALAALLVRRYCGLSRVAAAPAGGLSRARLEHVTAYIEEHLEGILSLRELAEIAGLGASHFKTLFRRSTGAPVHEYVVGRRIERARLLLTAGDATITEVAARTGFADASHLARWMRRRLGVSPRDVLRDGGD